MRRRDVLATAGFALSGSLAGCLASDSEPATATDRPRGGVVCRSEDRWAETEPVETHVIDDRRANRHARQWERCDLPPNAGAIEHPDADTAAEWNADYLGEGIATEPSVPFETTTRAVRETNWISGDSSYVADVLDSEDAEPSVETGEFGDLIRRRVEDTDFSESVLVFVGDCCGMPTSGQGWARVEASGGTLHLHGYRKRPYGGPQVPAGLYSLIEVERPAAELDVACVSYNHAQQTRLHFDSTDGPLSFLRAGIANDREEDVTVEMELTADGEKRVDSSFPVSARGRWNRIGTVGLPGTTFQVDVRIDSLGVDRSETYAQSESLGFRIRRDGTLDIGSSRDLY
ncbi:hypothetical protein [Salinirussus salinus]|uniref:hypothetical protein n=1 Tax=Salinirussus salinus TaxID=1198300 RepID=UPI001359088D|nr:hypothetical protein [Salinirussus salinus]